MPQASGVLCLRCRESLGQIDGIRSPFRFEGVIRKAIHELKYSNLKALSLSLAELLMEYVEENQIIGDIIIPVPLHKGRIKRRGYNQASLISHDLSKLTDIPVVDGCLVRIKEAKPQVDTESVVERWNNVASAFSCVDDRVAGKRILIIDDVCTTGATMESCACALKEGGASSVWGLSVARETQE